MHRGASGELEGKRSVRQPHLRAVFGKRTWKDAAERLSELAALKRSVGGCTCLQQAWCVPSPPPTGPTALKHTPHLPVKPEWTKSAGNTDTTGSSSLLFIVLHASGAAQQLTKEAKLQLTLYIHSSPCACWVTDLTGHWSANLSAAAQSSLVGPSEVQNHGAPPPLGSSFAGLRVC